MIPRMLSAYFLGRSDADVFSPAELVNLGAPSLDTAIYLCARAGYGDSERIGRAYLAGWREHTRFLVAAAAVGAVSYASGDVAR